MADWREILTGQSSPSSLFLPPQTGTAALLAKLQANPVGAERLNEQSLTNPTPGIDPVVGKNPFTGQPMTASQQEKLREQTRLAATMTLGMSGTMAGPTAVGADMDALGTALQMERAGETPEAIHQATKWFRGSDGEWKYEIPDKGATLDPNLERVSWDKDKPLDDQWLASWQLYGKKAGDILNHPELWKAYPELAETPMRSVGLAQLSGVKGGIYNDGSVGLSSAPPKDALSTLLHEIQHKIQDREGFARGGNVEEFLPLGHADEARALNDAVRDFEKTLTDNGLNSWSVRRALQPNPEDKDYLIRYNQTELAKARQVLSPEQITKYADLLAQLKRVEARTEQAFRHYERLAGEVESRNVQARHAAGDWSSFPLKTQDVPTEQQIVTYKGQKAQP